MKNKVTIEEIQELMDSLVFKFINVEGTTTTLAIAVLPQNNFVLAVGKSACVDPANYNKELGEKYSMADCKVKCMEKLWELEGYHLAKELLNDKGQDR